MIASGKKRELIIEDDHRSSRFGFLNEDDSRVNLKNDSSENINSRLAINFTQIIDLLNQRKMLLLKKIERMYEENSSRIEVISKGRIQDLKNQAKLLRDESISNLIDNSDRMNNTKNLLKRILEQHNFNQFETMEKVKGKKHYDRSKQVENQLNTKTKRYNILLDELQKLNEKQRQMFSKIQERESEMTTLLRRKQNNYLRKAQQIQEDVQRFKTIIKENKISKDRKKKEIQGLLASILDTLLSYENQTLDRVGDIQSLFGGQEVNDFDRFIRQIENLIDNKFDERRDDKKKRAVDELIKIANGYEAYIQQLNKQRQAEIVLIQDVNEGLKNMVKIALIQKVYFQDISNDKGRLIETTKKCKAYKSLLDTFEGDRVRLNKELSRISHMKNLFSPKLKALTSEQARKEQLKRQLVDLLSYKNQLQKYDKKYKEFEYMNNSYGLTRQTLQRQMDQCADKGNLVEYKSKLADLQKLDKQFQSQKQSLSIQEYQRLEYRLNGEVQNLYAKYADLIEAILMQGTQLNPSNFLTQLSKRLAII